MEDTAIVEKNNLRKHEWHFPRAVEVFYPSKIGSTQDRHNWITAMILDSRLGDRDKVVLARLALHLNLKTGRLDPSIDLLAMETSLSDNQASGRRMVRRCLARAEKIGWIERTGRHAGYRFNRSNSYRLTVPKDIRPDKSSWSSGQIEHVVRTPESPRIGKENREREHSFFKRAAVAQGSRGEPQSGPKQRKGPSGVSSEAHYTEAELERVRDALAEGPLTMGGIISFLREHGEIITGSAIAHMARDGHLERAGGRYWVVLADVEAWSGEVET